MIPATFWKKSGPVFNIATLNFSLLIDAALTGYTGSAPWNGNTSAGPSFNRNLVTAGSDPTSGTALGAYTPGQFDGLSNTLKTIQTNNALLSGSSGSVVALCYPTAIPSTSGVNYQDGNLLEDGANGETGFGLTSAGVGITVYDGFSYVTATAPYSTTNAWVLLQYRYSTTNGLTCRANGNAWSSASAMGGALPFLTPGQMSVGYSYAGSTKWAGRIAMIATSTAEFTNTEFDNIRNYANGTYPVSV